MHSPGPWSVSCEPRTINNVPPRNLDPRGLTFHIYAEGKIIAYVDTVVTREDTNFSQATEEAAENAQLISEAYKIPELKRRERILIDHMAEILAHCDAPEGVNKEQPMSIKELCENCIKELNES